jgi:S1-C subfamily serine protease
MGTKPRTFAFAAALLATIFFTGTGRAATDFPKLFPSIVRIAAFNDEGGGALGSGVVVASNDTGSYVITNFHVVNGSDPSRILVVAPKPGAPGTGGEDDVIISPARFVSGDGGTDIAVLYVAKFFAPPLPLAIGPAAENTAVRAVGYPGTDAQWKVMKTTPTMTDGIVSTTQTAPWEDGLPPVGQIQHTAVVNHGMSGGPLFDLCGRVIAIDTAYWTGGRNVNLALSAADVTPYLQRLNIAYKATKDVCDPNAPAPPIGAVNAPLVKTVTNTNAPITRDDGQNAMRLGIGAGVIVLLLGLVGIGIWLARAGKSREAAAPVEAAPAGPPHGLALRGVNEASGKMQVVRQDELRNEVGVELGRSSGFGSPATSRRHARVIWSPSFGFAIRDLGSTGGTRVNGREIKGGGDAPIHLGDVVEFGAPDARYTVEKI